MVIVALTFFTAGCSSMEPYEYKQEADAEMSSPGLLTGEEGEKVIFKIPKESKDETDQSKAEDDSKDSPNQN